VRVRPIRPVDASRKKRESIPDTVFSVFNHLIAENFDGRQAVIKQCDILSALKPMFISINMNWLDVEDIYREAGWIVDYDKPAYNETYEATFTFKRKA